MGRAKRPSNYFENAVFKHLRGMRTRGGLAQLARAPALQAGGQRFESVILHCFVARIQRVKRVESVLFSTEEERTKVIFDILTNVKAMTN